MRLRMSSIGFAKILATIEETIRAMKKVTTSSVRNIPHLLLDIPVLRQITNSRQVRLHSLILHKLPQPLFDSWTRIKIAENIDLSLQLLIRDRLHKRLRRGRRPPVELPHLAGRGACHS